MAGSERKIYHFIFIATIVALFIFKWHDLYLPYFWDELGVYTRSADYQFHHKLGIMPASVPADYSRGHPLLFTFISACAMRVFDESIFAVHLFCLCISALLLLAVYLKTSRYFNPLTGIVSTLILAVQPLFLAQSCLVLPEITLALFLFLALCSYYENKFVLFAIYTSLAVLTKEPAIVLPLVVLVYSLVQWALLRIRPRGLNPGALLLTIVPYLIFGLFLLLQKQQNGWYVFPVHMDLITTNSETLWRQFSMYFNFIFTNQGRRIQMDIMFVAAAVSLLFTRWRSYTLGRSVVPLLLIFIVAFFAFNSLFSIFMARYSTAALVAFSILAGVSLTVISPNRWFTGIATMIILFLCTQYFEGWCFNYDADLGYRRQVNVLHQAVNYAETLKPGNSRLGNFPANPALYLVEAGYLNGTTVAERQPGAPDKYYFLWCEPGGGVDIDQSVYQLKHLRTFNDGFAQVRVFWVVKK